MKYVLKLIVSVSIISLHSGAHADEIGDKATKIYVSFFKSFVSKDIPEVRQKCLKKFINTSTDLQFKQAGAPITSMDKTKTLQWLSDSVKNIEFFPNGKLASDYNSTQPIAQLIEFVDKNVCQ
jgi:hypothetical protein